MILKNFKAYFKKYGLQFWLLCLSSFLFFGSFNMILPELPDFMRSFGAEKFIGLHIALFTLTAGLSRPLSGKLTDRWGRVPVMVVGAVVTGVVSLVYPFAMTVVGFLLLRLLHGFSTGFKPTGTTAYIGDLVPADSRGEAMGLVSFCGMIGMGLGNYIGPEIVIAYGNYDILFYWSSVVAVLSVVILLGMKETLSSPEKFKMSLLKVGREDIYEPSAIRPAMVLLFTTFSFGVVVTLVPDFGEHLNIRNKGEFFVYFTISSLVARIAGGKLSDIFGRVPVLYCSTLTVALSAVCIGIAETPTVFFIGGLLFGVGYGLTSPSLFAWVIDLSPSEFRGRAISTAFIALEIGIGSGALLAGAMYQSNISRIPLIFFISAVLAICAFIYLIISKPKTA